MKNPTGQLDDDTVEQIGDGLVTERLAATIAAFDATRAWPGSGRAAVAIREGAWSIGGYAATQLLRTVATLALARHFLGPEPFGVVGLVGVFIAGLGMF